MNKGYALVLNEWIFDSRIRSELPLLIAISSLTAEKGYCFASNEYFAEKFETTTVTISRKIKKLIDLGYIDAVYKRTGASIKSRTMTINIPDNGHYQKGKRRLTKMLTADNKNVKDNITSNNTTSNDDNNDHHQNQKNRIPDLNSEDPNATVEMSKEAILRKKFMDKVGSEFASPDEAFQYMNYCVYQMTDFWNHLKREWGISRASRQKIINATKEFSTWSYSKRVKAKPPKTMLPMLKSFMKEIDVREYKLVN